MAGAITLALFVGLGVFVYPWLLRQRFGRSSVAVLTVLLAGLFIAFEGSGASTYSSALAAAWALGPVIAGVVVWRLQRNNG